MPLTKPHPKLTRLTCDLEGSGLLNEDYIDYTTTPYTLREGFAIHCVVVQNIDTDEIVAFYDGPEYVFDGREYEETDGKHIYTLKDYEPIVYTRLYLKDFVPYVQGCENLQVIGHNFINYDILACKLKLGMDYEIEVGAKGKSPDSWAGRSCSVDDTMVLSKTLNADRYGGHSLDNLAKMSKAPAQKLQFRKKVNINERFKYFAADMLYYNIFDVLATTHVYNYLMYEWDKGDTSWMDAYKLEKKVVDIVTRQEHRGFHFFKDKALSSVRELDEFIQDAKDKIEPLLPKKPIGKIEGKQYVLNAKQFLQGTGEKSKHLLKFVDKHGGEWIDDRVVKIFDKEWTLPLPKGIPMVTHVTAKIKDTTHIKKWLVQDIGWVPLEWKDRDLTKKVKAGVGNVKRTKEEYAIAVDKYVEETLNGPFSEYRLEHLNATRDTIKSKLLKRGVGRSVKVLTNPSFTVGQEKDPCPNLLKLADKFPYVEDMVKYLTYRHRRNTILGGDFDPEFVDIDDGGEPEKGYIPSVRQDGRIPTPADTCGAGTRRMKHKCVANVPRTTSLYGQQLRELFGVDEGSVQIGYDFDSLEAREEAHYCWEYDKTKDYCNSLLASKPNSVHCKLARAVSKILNRDFGRNAAKSVRYGCLPVDNSEVLTKDGWKGYPELTVGEVVLTYSTSTEFYEWKPITHLWFYKDAQTMEMSNDIVSLESTEDHRWYGYKRVMKGSGKLAQRNRINKFHTTEEINSECGILHAAKHYEQESAISPEEAELVAWLLSDGYYSWSTRSETTSCSFGKRKGIVANITQAEHKSWEEVERVLCDNNMPYNKTEDLRNENKVYNYALSCPEIRDFLDRVVRSREQKHDVNWTAWVLTLSREALEKFFHAFWLADGTSDKWSSVKFDQNGGNIHDALMVVGNLLGYRGISSLRVDSSKCRDISFNSNAYTSGQRLKKVKSRITDVFCITNENSTFVMKQNNFITITGNCAYGARAPRVAKIIGDTVEIGTIVFDTFWDEAKPLAKLVDDLKEFWETDGEKRWIPGLDGGRIHTRSPHAILNSLLQSSGVICAKRAMVIHEQKLKAEGLTVDFFKDALDKSKPYCQQLIAYHDEAQLEVDAKSVKWKVIKFDQDKLNGGEAKEHKAKKKEEIEEAKKEIEASTGRVWSDIGETNKGYYIGYHRAGELAVEAVREAGEYYNLNVDLTAGYSVGKNWADCH